MRLAALLLLCGCWGHSLPGWDATPEAGFDRMAAARLTLCSENNRCQFHRQCLAESVLYCLDGGRPEGCGRMEREASCGTGVK